MTVSPTMGQGYVVLVRRERRRRTAIFDQSRIDMINVDAGNLTVYEIHNPTTIASNRSTFSSWLSKSPIIVGCLSDRISERTNVVVAPLNAVVPSLCLTY